jgi:hypothetical protein
MLPAELAARGITGADIGRLQRDGTLQRNGGWIQGNCAATRPPPTTVTSSSPPTSTASPSRPASRPAPASGVRGWRLGSARHRSVLRSVLAGAFPARPRTAAWPATGLAQPARAAAVRLEPPVHSRTVPVTKPAPAR